MLEDRAVSGIEFEIFQLVLLWGTYGVALGQYMGPSYGMRPDVSFNDYNDRFDLDAIVQEQERMFPQPKLPEDYRRHTNRRRKFEDSLSSSSSSEREDRKDQLLERAPELKELPIKKQFVPVLDMKPGINMENNDFAYHDNMESGYETDYEKHLKPFQRSRRTSLLLYEMNKILYGGQRRSGRRTMEGVDPVTEVLFRHAVPVKISIDGFIKLPPKLVQ